MSSARSTYRRPRTALVVLAVLIGLAVPIVAAPAGAAGPIAFTILHTNDFHGNLELSGSNPGAARVAQKIADVRTAVGAANVLTFDGGDIMQGSLLSNLQQGLPVIDYYNTIGYNATTLGNHEFDWGQTVLGARMAQANFPLLAANVTLKDGLGNCTWTPYGDGAWQVFTVGTAPNTVKVGVIGVSSVETPYITIAAATEGLCFRDPYESILQHYAALDAASDVMVVLSHNGWTDGGYGYGFTVYGDQTLAGKLNTAGKPVNLIIGGHSHTDVSAAVMVGNTAVVQAHYAGRKVGRADMTYDPGTGAVNRTYATGITGHPRRSPTVVSRAFKIGTLRGFGNPVMSGAPEAASRRSEGNGRFQNVAGSAIEPSSSKYTVLPGASSPHAASTRVRARSERIAPV